MGFAKWFASLMKSNKTPKMKQESSDRVPRKIRQQAKQEYLQSFLAANGFRSISSPLSIPYDANQKEVVYPIHAAAAYGCPHLVRMLLLMGADPTIRSSLGQTAAEFAEESNENGSHAEVLDLLRNDVKVVNINSAMDVMLKQRQSKGELLVVEDPETEGQTVTFVTISL